MNLYALSNDTKQSSLATIIWEIFTFPVYSIFYRLKNLKVTITPEKLIARNLMTNNFS